MRTIRTECLDWLLILNPRQLERGAAVFVDHDNVHRPHRALALNPPHPTPRPMAAELEAGGTRIRRRDRLGGVVREYSRAALSVSAPYRRESMTLKDRSVVASRSRRRPVRCRTCSWWRSASISSWSAARECAEVRRVWRTARNTDIMVQKRSRARPQLKLQQQERTI